MGKLYAALHQAIQSSDLVKAQELQGISQQFVTELLEMGVLPGIKAIMTARGIAAGPTRAPLMPLSDKSDAIVKRMSNDPRFDPYLITA